MAEKKNITTAVAKPKAKPPAKTKIQKFDPQALIATAIEKGMDVAVLEKLLNMRERIVREDAERQFREAMSAFQAELPVIKKQKSVMNKPEKGGGLRYKYATIDEIMKQVQPYIGKHNLSYDIETSRVDGGIMATVIVFHVAGHSKKSSFAAPVDPEAYMTAPQKWAAARTFAVRYAFMDAFGIVTGDEDTDAADVGSGDTGAMREKLNALSPDAQEGLRILGYGVKAAHMFCEKFGWDERKILHEIQKIVDGRNANAS